MCGWTARAYHWDSIQEKIQNKMSETSQITQRSREYVVRGKFPPNDSLSKCEIKIPLYNNEKRRKERRRKRG